MDTRIQTQVIVAGRSIFFWVGKVYIFAIIYHRALRYNTRKKWEMIGMIGTLINRWFERATFKKGRAKIIVYITLVLILSTLIYLTYDEYKKAIIVQQQQNMLRTARSISRSIELFTREVVDSIRILTLDKDFAKNISDIKQGKVLDVYNDKLKSYYEAEGKALNAVYLFDENGKLLTQYPQGKTQINSILKADIDYVVIGKKTHIGKVYLDEAKNTFILSVSEPVFDGDKFKGVISVEISLYDIYNRLIAPVKVGEKGYAMVKDQYGTIIMHPVKEQVGMNVIDSRKKKYPDLDYSELEDLIKNQLKGNEGTAIYYSYWWGDNVLRKIKKLNAYTPVRLGEQFWVIALVMSYDEIQEPINKFLIKIGGIVSLIASLIYILISELIMMRKSKEELEKETIYLKMLNESSEKLRKKEAELYHSHKLKMIGTLAGGIAHDINNLLTPILGYSELLLESLPEGSEYYDDIDEIFKAAQRGKELVEQILSFSRNDTGAVKMEPLSISKITKETLKLLKTVLPKNVVLKENIKEDCGYIRGNYAQINQVIFNLCTNAYQAIKDNEGIIEISLSTVQGVEINENNVSLSSERNYVELTVKDTGCGMDEETKVRIFEPFFTTKTIGEGTGLGLFVVQSIIDKHEGAITVESEKGRGSCFRVYLPLIDGQADLENDNDSEVIIKNNKKILLVDDNEKIIKVLKKGLEHLGYEVVAETNSQRALEKFWSDYNKFDIVITDYMMPGLKGSELAADIKKIKKNTGVILMSGYIDESEKVVSSNNLIDAYISKPIELIKLSKVIERVLVGMSLK